MTFLVWPPDQHDFARQAELTHKPQAIVGKTC
jgi:hypothetical protein